MARHTLFYTLIITFAWTAVLSAARLITYTITITMDTDTIIKGQIDFGPVEDTTRNIIKVVGVGGGGCNAVGNIYREGLKGVTFAVCNTDSKSLSVNPVPTKIMLGEKGHGVGGNPARGREEAEKNREDIQRLFSDNTEMAFVVATLGGGTGTGAAPLVANIAKERGLLTVGVVTLPFYFERKPKIYKALKGLEEIRKNVDSLIIINNEQISKVYNDADISVDEALERADAVIGKAVRGIAEIVLLPGKIQTDLEDVKTTMTDGGGAIMSIGRASGDHRLQNAILDALSSPLLYGSDISKATRILFNMYASSAHPLKVKETRELAAFMDDLLPDIDVIWGMATDDTLDEDVKITIVATGFDNSIPIDTLQDANDLALNDIIVKLYGKKPRKRSWGQPPTTGGTSDTATPTGTADPDKTETPSTSPMDTTGKATATIQPAEDEFVNPAETFYQRVATRIKAGLALLVSDDNE